MPIEIHSKNFPSLDLKNERALWFSSQKRAFFREKLQSLAEQENRRLFVETDQEGICRVGLTSVHQVLLTEADGVELSDSHALHRLEGEVAPLELGKWYELAIDPGSNLILWAEETESRESRVESTFTVPNFEIDPSTLPSISQDLGEAFFASVARQPHIPFHYHGNGCWVRAHEMCRLIEESFDVNPDDVVGKVWMIPGRPFRLRSVNSPTCSVEWRYHVAPLVNVDHTLKVIDPVLAGGLTTVGEWISLQGTPHQIALKYTSRSAYSLLSTTSKKFVGEKPGQSGKELKHFQGELIQQILSHGPLPYPCQGSP